MEKWIADFQNALVNDGKSENTVKSYTLAVKEYFRWFSESYGDTEFKGLYRANIQEYKSYLKNIKRVGKDQTNLDAKSINAKLSALVKFNELMQPENIVISKADFIKIQENAINPTDITKKDVEEFRQRILQSEGCGSVRNYAIVTILAYAGLRISEVLKLKKIDVATQANQIRVSDGKGEKQRIVVINSKIVDAINDYMNTDFVESEYLFHNNKGKPLNRTTINKVFNEFSENITPHTLRHFYCTNALESGAYSINEVSQQAGHSDIRTTMRYTNPNLKKMIEKADLL